MEPNKRNVLVLCTGNSARSILGEALFNRICAEKVAAYSAGSQPKDEPHPAALSLLQAKGYDVSFARSKSWDEFAVPNAQPIDIIVTVCDNAAAESCPVWPGHPMTVHWGIPDPAAVAGNDNKVRDAFELAYSRLERRVQMFQQLDLDMSDQAALRTRLQEIGELSD